MAVRIPPGVSPGQSFQIMVNGQQMAVNCPDGMGPGQTLQIQVPAPTAVAQPAPMATAVAQPVQPAMGQVVAGTPVQPMAAVPAGFGAPPAQPGGRPAPPGAPPGGYWQQVEYVGVVTWIVSLLVVPVCCCPCDNKELYFAPDGTHYNAYGAKDEMFGPCNCC